MNRKKIITYAATAAAVILVAGGIALAGCTGSKTENGDVSSDIQKETAYIALESKDNTDSSKAEASADVTDNGRYIQLRSCRNF